jgi:hypothetical protein
MRVYVNAVPVDAADGQTAVDAVRLFDAVAADGVANGSMIITDSRGLPAPPSTPLHGGAIFRLIPARQRDADTAVDGD